MRPVLVLVNGLPGSGKSTLARAWCDGHPGAVAMDVDVLRAMVGGWRDRPLDAGLAARAMAVAAMRVRLADGNDVVVPQLLHRPEFVEQLQAVAAACGAGFLHVVLDVGPEAAEARLTRRTAAGGGLAEGPVDLPLDGLHDRLAAFLRTRPEALRLGSDDGPEALDRLIAEHRDR